MHESQQHHEKHRAASRVLTTSINDAKQYPNVRCAVIQILTQLDKRISGLNQTEIDCIVTRQTPHRDRCLVRIHLTGRNALNACLSEDADPLRSGTSAWEMQILVNPWLPARAQQNCYRRAKRIVSDELAAARIQIALGLHRDTQMRSKIAPAETPNQPLSVRTIDLLELRSGTVQAANLICEELKHTQNPYGLNSLDLERHAQRLTPKDVSKQRHDRYGKGDAGPAASNGPTTTPTPSILTSKRGDFSKAYRLAYTWHFEQSPAGANTSHSRRNNHSIEEKHKTYKDDTGSHHVLMKLVGITILRPDTIGAIMAWSDLEPYRPMSRDPELGKLALPSLDYHFRKTMIALCKVADNSSREKQALSEYERRFIRLYDSATSFDQANGESDTAQVDRQDTYRTCFITTLSTIAGKTLKEENPTRLMKDLMTSVELRSLSLDPQRSPADQAFNADMATSHRIMRARSALKAIVHQIHRTAFPELPPLSAAFSDDLALIELLKRHPYIDVEQFPFLGMDMAAVVRIPYEKQITLKSAELSRSLDDFPLIRMHRHSTPRAGSISHETTIALCNENTILTLITLTSATSYEAPFHPLGEDLKKCRASLLDIQAQRKAAIALTADYVLRRQSGRQYELIQHALSEHSRLY
ncbi:MULTISPECIES: hypothetical protein [unclassified Xanthomonas]|uniref:hypothetical protein n=1 Tax=unclassified Xanthomonas TaxID=2643310 RepID=UPI002B23283F|nr:MULTISPECIES: hypothetical protein [unclassified Xanthomonas]MEA9564526.1 hypothetical protein [Xanthomonas sp. WHRI 8932A]MEA9635942.1 hypothetical protein [Xanthomonas sp. WHRI 8812E]